jgi:xylulokinase
MDRGARSALWRQIVADVLGRAIEYAPGADLGSAFGVAWVAGVALGAWGWARPAVPAGVVHHPLAERTARYDALYQRYRELGGFR